MNSLLSRILLLVFCLMIYSCSSNIYETVFPTLVDGRYDSEFPYNSSSKQLEEVGDVVKMVNTLAFYSTHSFSEESAIRVNQLSQEIVDKYTEGSGFFNHTASGTATVITASLNSVVLLTCAHIVNFPDTIISYYPNEMGGYTDKIQSIAVKEKQTIWIIGFPSRGEVDLLIADDVLDVAVLGAKYKTDVNFTQDAFSYPIGRADQLEWGTFVYVFGYPLNYKMITKGIVSSPNRDKKGSFLLDAVFNKGYSGGIVLAIRDGVPNFEFVGIIKSVPSEIEYYLKPGTTKEEQKFNPNIPYEGEIFVEQRQNLKYGITKVIPVERIMECLEENSTKLSELGYSLKSFTSRE